MLVLLGLSAAVLLAAGYVLQQHEAAQVPAGGRRPRLLLVLARRPVWLGGIAAMVGGQVLGATALGMGSLIVVEPLLAANVLFALPLAALASRRRLSRGDWAGALLLVGGLALFLLGSATRRAVDSARRSPATWLVTGSALVGVVALLLLVVAVAGLTFAQTAFGLADISASLPAITLAEPVVGIALATAVLGQQLPHRLQALALAIGGLTLMVVVVVILTRSPLVVDPHGARLHHRHHHRPRP